MDKEFSIQIEAFAANWARIVAQVRRIVAGHERLIDEVLTCLFSGGHALLEGVPGIGKTLLVRTIGQASDLSFSRVQFTPDLMPADITGTNIVREVASGRGFEFQAGPIFANLVLADEINRATPKTQSAMLEAMQERTVSVARVSHELPCPFFVLATQNPIEMEGTYPLPEAQLDRFMLKLTVDLPSADEMGQIIDRTTGSSTALAEKTLDIPEILAMQRTVRMVELAANVRDYISRLVLATHNQFAGACDIVKRFVRYGSSPRGAQAITMAAKVTALRAGRANVAFDDIRKVVASALRHRLVLSFEGRAEGVNPDRIIEQVVESTSQNSAV